jgi:hypothetical protein
VPHIWQVPVLLRIFITRVICLALTLSPLASEHRTTIALESYNNTHTDQVVGESMYCSAGVAGFAPTMLGVARVNVYAYLVTV